MSFQRVVPDAIRNAVPTGTVLKKRDLEFCKRHTRFDEKVTTFFFVKMLNKLIKFKRRVNLIKV